MNIKRAIISVWDKTGILEFASFLKKNGVELLCTEGTANFLEENGIEVKRISEYIGFPEFLEGKVKTFHPKIFGGILAEIEKPSQKKELEEMEIEKIDMVIVNFLPFEKLAEETANEKRLLDMIDVGGLALLRAAAKNYRETIPVSDPKDYQFVMENISECGDVPLFDRRKLALKAFYVTSLYDAKIYSVLSKLFASEKFEHMFFEILGNLRYGANPLQEATLLKLVKENNFYNNVKLLTPAKLPTLRILMDLKLIYDLKSVFEDELIMYFKKGIFVFGYYKPTDEDKKNFLKKLSKFRGGTVFVEDKAIIDDLKMKGFDSIITTVDYDPKNLIDSKSTVFSIDPKRIQREEEIISLSDIFVMQETRNIKVQKSEEGMAIMIANFHKTDTVVWLKNNLLVSGVSGAFNRKIALNSIINIADLLEIDLKDGTFVFDNTINDEKVIELIKDLNPKKMIFPPTPMEDMDTMEKIKSLWEVEELDIRMYRY